VLSELKTRHGRLGLVVLMIVAVCLSVSIVLALDARFHADDFQQMPRLQVPLGDSIVGFFTAPDPNASQYFRPLAHTTQRVLMALFGPRAWVFHLLNLLLHVAATCFLYRLAKSVAGTKIVAAACATVFAVHATHAEAVVFASNISGLGGATFYLGTLHCLDRFRKNGEMKWALWSMIGTILSAGFSEIFVTLPLAAWMISRQRTNARRAKMPIAGMVAIGAVVWAWRLAIGVRTEYLSDTLTLNPLGWVRNALFYLAHFLLPIRSIFHAIGYENYQRLRDALPVVPDSAAYLAVVAAAAIGVVMVGFRVWKKLPQPVRTGLLLALVTAIPVVTLNRTGMRLLYLPSVGLALAVAGLIAADAADQWRRRLLWLWIAIMSVALVDQVAVWRRAGRLAEQVLTQAADIREVLSADRAVVFADVPQMRAGAMVFSIGLVEAVRWKSGYVGDVYEFGNINADTTGIPLGAAWYEWSEDRFVGIDELTVRTRRSP